MRSQEVELQSACSKPLQCTLSCLSINLHMYLSAHQAAGFLTATGSRRRCRVCVGRCRQALRNACGMGQLQFRSRRPFLDCLRPAPALLTAPRSAQISLPMWRLLSRQSSSPSRAATSPAQTLTAALTTRLWHCAYCPPPPACECLKVGTVPDLLL